MTLYKINRYGKPVVEAAEFERVTQNFAVGKNGRRQALRSEYDNWFTTPEEAITHYRERLARNLDSAKNYLLRLESAFDEFEALHGPGRAQ